MTDEIHPKARELLAKYEGKLRVDQMDNADATLQALSTALREIDELREAASAVVFGCSRYEHDKGNEGLALAVIPIAQGFSGQTFSLGELRRLAALLKDQS